MYQRFSIKQHEHVEMALKTPGERLPPELRCFFEQRIDISSPLSPNNHTNSNDSSHITFESVASQLEAEARRNALTITTGSKTSARHDFSRVRIHTGPVANSSARALQARAYTVGEDILFADGEYSPNTSAGRALLAHELTHVLQQRSLGRKMVQCAEVGDSALPPGITLADIKSDVNTKVRTAITAGRTASRSLPTATARGFAVAEHVYDELGRTMTHLAPVETWLNGLPQSTPASGGRPAVRGKIYIPRRADTRYAGVSAWSTGNLAPVAKIERILMGTDKIGHFFQLGYYYFARAHSSVSVLGDSHGTDASELGLFGLGSTGVYSRADLDANHKGRQFYEDLRSRPTMTFDIADYASSAWNESTNTNYYAASIAAPVWRHAMNRQWGGTFSVNSLRSSSPITVDLSVRSDRVSGDFRYETNSGRVSGSVSNGRIQYITSPSHRDAVTHIEIKYDWSSGANSGKGKWVSRSETELSGTWGYGASRTSGGTWDLAR